tara:strand:- start:1985 stop:3247 length:1263 start_codon:yes stop_codon:yes gene_type:complete
MRYTFSPDVQDRENQFLEKIRATTGHLCNGLGKVDARFVEEAIFGIAESGSVRLTSISRVLGEDIALHATHKRLSRNLAHEAIGQVLSKNLLTFGTQQLMDNSLLLPNCMDVEKKYAEKMDFLGEIDVTGSRKGYEMCEIVAAKPLQQDFIKNVDGEEITFPDRDFVPLNQELWSRNAPDYTGVNQHILKLVSDIRSEAGAQGILVSTRQHDDPELLVPWSRSNVDRFVIRQRAESRLMYRNTEKSVDELIELCSTPYGSTVFALGVGASEHETGHFIHFGFLPVRLPELPERILSLVVVKGLDEPIALLTTEPMRRNRGVLQEVVKSYFIAWSVRATSRFMKNDYQFSDIRVLTYQRLKNMATLLSVMTYMDTLWPGGRATIKGIRFDRRKGTKDMHRVYHLTASREKVDRDDQREATE